VSGGVLSSASDDDAGGSSGSRAAVLRRSEPTRLSSANDDKVGGLLARSAASGASKSNTAMREQLTNGCPGLQAHTDEELSRKPVFGSHLGDIEL
jgi:hypothetical protein